MNILRPNILNDNFLNRAFDVTEQLISSTDGLVYITLDHVDITLKLIIDIDLDTGTLVMVNDSKIKYQPSHTFGSVDELYVLIKSILEHFGVV